MATALRGEHRLLQPMILKICTESREGEVLWSGARDTLRQLSGYTQGVNSVTLDAVPTDMMSETSKTVRKSSELAGAPSCSPAGGAR